MNGSFNEVNTIPPNTYVYWEYLNDLIQEEPAGVAGPELTGQMAAIGIVKGNPFSPDDRMKNLLKQLPSVMQLREPSPSNQEMTVLIFMEKNMSGIRFSRWIQI